MSRAGAIYSEGGLQGHLAHQRTQPPRTLQYSYASGPTVVLGDGQFLTRYPCIYPEAFQPACSEEGQSVQEAGLSHSIPAMGLTAMIGRQRG
jgi:hypothetical protein